MSKLQVRVQLDIDWIMALEDNTLEQAVQWLQHNVPDGYMLEKEYYGYDGGCEGILTSTREETDEEYEDRKAKERIAEQQRKLYQKLKEESEAMRMERLKLEDIALHEYLSKFTGNPHLNDLENLFKATAQMEAQGRVGVVLDNLKECMARLEKGMP